MAARVVTQAVLAAVTASSGHALRNTELGGLSVDDVQELLEELNLSKFLGKAFEEYQIDGRTLQVLKPEDIDLADFPSAKAFHWTKFWDVLDELKSSPAEGNAADTRKSQRKLADTDEYSGINIKREKAWLSLGPDADVSIRRSGDNELSVVGRLLVEGSTGEQINVADTLESLCTCLDDSSGDSSDERLDELIDMVTLNTELLRNVSQSCDEAAAVAAEVPLFTCVDALNNGEGDGTFLTEDYGYVVCNNGLSIGGWTLAMNIDTADGNVVSYNNQAFWEDSTTLGGATTNVNGALQNDYKNNDVFGSFAVGEILVVVHDEGETLGWRAFNMLDTTQPLSYYFQGGDDATNVCGTSFDDQATLSRTGYVAMTSGSFDADIGDLISLEGLVYADDCDLIANVDISGSVDYNRLLCAAHPEDTVNGNYGYGLGTLYDATSTMGDSLDEPVCPSETKRPLCDAQFHTDTTNWGSSGDGIGGMIGTDNTCNDGCPWTVESGFHYDYAIYVREASSVNYADCEEAMAEGAETGAYFLSSGKWVYCNNDISLGGWTLALNVDTSDGNVVSYNNYDFWESSTELGGAKDYAPRPFVHDYKNADVFSSFEATEILVVLHEEGEMLGYRAWMLANAGQPLVEYFTAENTCGSDGSYTSLTSGGFNYVTTSVLDSFVGDDVIEQEPLIYHDNYQLYSNIETGESQDYNRLTAKDHPELTTDSGNYGWGLGTLYDATSDSSVSGVDAPCPSLTARPLCDAQFHVTGTNWGANGGNLGGMIGADNECNSDCPWTAASGYEWDYAIYVRKSEPVYYADCAAVAAAGEPSGQYLLSNNEKVYCYIDDAGAGWTLCLNIQTSDGNVVHYSNTDFWESATALGGATEHHGTPWRQDYKNTYVFSEFEPTALMVIVHEDGVGAQSESLGWRSWTLADNSPLINAFTNANACGDGVTSSSMSGSSYYALTAGIIDGAVNSLIEEEPIVYHEYELFANVECGSSEDYNRLAAKSSATDGSGNYGWGLGTLYDATTGNTNYMCGPEGSTTARPQCDAQFHTTGTNWGSSGSGVGGMIGTDNVCVSDCPWTAASGYSYDYAIFVQ